ncbi:MAG: aminopeptidase [Bacteroidales bacterium]|nr:aminopeptidase [Bacteroidales bacterium]
MKKLLFVAMFAALSVSAVAGPKGKNEKTPEKEGYVFTEVSRVAATPVKNQASSGTCWAYSTLSFLESEILRVSGKEVDLSEMFVAAHTYSDRAEKYVRLHGRLEFGPGSGFGSALAIIKKYGLVPQESFEGLNYGTKLNKHGELNAILTAYVQTVVKNPNKELSTAWKRGFDAVVAAYFGEYPKDIDAKAWFDGLGLNLDDYVSLTSWTHHPFYTSFPVEVQDNWTWSQSYNLPIDEFMAVIDSALDNGYSIGWGSDVSEKGFNRKGLGVYPDYAKIVDQMPELEGSDQMRWVGSNIAPDKAYDKALEAPCAQKVVTQEERQAEFDNYNSTDDHGMHIIGKAKDQKGNPYYIVKNSWGPTGEYKGYWYVTPEFVRAKTMDILINKNAIPANIKAKLGL